jgi:CheY-like chemotaxis protein
MIRQEELELSVPPVKAPGEQQRVLLVEDDPALRRYLEIVLQRAGYEVVSAGDGLEAMKFLLGTTVDAIITDALMPHLDGYELCRFVRSSAHLSHLPIILLSALDQKNSTDEAEQVDAFLSKPVSPDVLLVRLFDVLNQEIERRVGNALR